MSDKRADVTLLMTRRITILVLRQILQRLPGLAGLDKTPAAYWQEVLQMSHQGAMKAKTLADKAGKSDGCKRASRRQFPHTIMFCLRPLTPS